jgi:hypothetical protein
MLQFDDERWAGLQGGRRFPYDPRRALQDLERGANVAAVWSELWDELHHQGDVDSASYAAVPHLVRVHRLRDVADWNTYSLVGAIEHWRSSPRNPAIPAWLKSGYDEAWRALPALAMRDLARSEDPLLTRCALGVVAMARGLRRAGEILLEFTDDELEEMISQYLGERS